MVNAQFLTVEPYLNNAKQGIKERQEEGLKRPRDLSGERYYTTSVHFGRVLENFRPDSVGL